MQQVSLIAKLENQLRKSEQYAVSLRKQKKDDKIRSKRQSRHFSQNLDQQLLQKLNFNQEPEEVLFQQAIDSLRQAMNNIKQQLRFTNDCQQSEVENIFGILINNGSKLDDIILELLNLEIIEVSQELLRLYPLLSAQIIVQLSVGSDKNVSVYITEKSTLFQPSKAKQSLLDIIFNYAQEQTDDIIMKEQFYTLIGNIGNDGVYPRDQVFKLEGLFDMMLIDLTNERLIDFILWSLYNLVSADLVDKTILKNLSKVVIQVQRKYDILHQWQSLQMFVIYLIGNVCRGSKNLCSKMLQEYRFFLLEMLQRYNFYGEEMKQYILLSWIKITYNLPGDQLSNLVKESNIVDQLRPDHINYLLAQHSQILTTLANMNAYQIPLLQSLIITILRNIFQLAKFEDINKLEIQHSQLQNRGLIHEVTDMINYGVVNHIKSTVRSGLKFLKSIMKREDILQYVKLSPQYGEPWRQEIIRLMNIIIIEYVANRKLYSMAIDILEKDFNDNQESIDLGDDDEEQYSEYKIQKIMI
ncbi:UNKNOWN [Stylonychia lemnae]|uniref:Uncharacterized protein n=1 Tax=Stylonychia lemnae TaxID=5949 RepID=A0A078A0D7_STYLE|nr:UNKNOWN [Stylonychia lemnae]|eukprot:CDW74248.1 UNKNOWN [Stylonychia lemnae]